MGKKILGLDMGTNSLGWAIVEQHNRRFELVDKGVKIFPLGVNRDKSGESSKASERTQKRSSRRLKARKRYRKYFTLKALIEHDPPLCPLSPDELTAWKKSGYKAYPMEEAFLSWQRTDALQQEHPYAYRDLFSRETQDWRNKPELAFKLGRAFYHLAQRRGFASNRKDAGADEPLEAAKLQYEELLRDPLVAEDALLLKDKLRDLADIHLESDDKTVKAFARKIRKVAGGNETDADAVIAVTESLLTDKENMGLVKKSITELSEAIEAADCETLGQYFHQLMQQDRSLYENRIRGRYTERESHYEAEFNLIADKQQLPDELRKQLHRAIFFQRPLKSQKGSVGKCPFEPSKSRCPITHPLFEEYRMRSFLNNIAVQTADDLHMRPLSEAEKSEVEPLFYRVSKPSFPVSDIFDRLFGKDTYCYRKDHRAAEYSVKVNYNPATTVSGCPFTGRLMQVFKNSPDEHLHWKTLIVNRWTGKSLSENDIITRYWQALYFADTAGDRSSFTDVTRESALRRFADTFTSLTAQETARFTKIPPFRNDYANLSLKAIKLILPWLREGLIYSHAVFLAKLPEIIKPEIWENAANQAEITEQLISIIDGHDELQQLYFAVNEIVRNVRDGKMTEPENPHWVRAELEHKLSFKFGKKTWQEHPHQQSLISQAVSIFNAAMKTDRDEPVFQRTARLEDRIEKALKGKKIGEVAVVASPKMLKKLYHPSAIERFVPEVILRKGEPLMKDGKPLYGLPNPLKSSLKNPVVMRSLQQLRQLINHLLAEELIDEKTSIHIELARELNDANKRKAIENYQRKRQNERSEYRDEIIRLYKEQKNQTIEPTETDIQKYQLWKEQNGICLYTGDKIGLSDFIGDDPKYDIEHTLPRSRTLDNSMMNKTLSERTFNRDVKRNRMPSELENYDDYVQRIRHWVEKADALEDRINRLSRRTKAATTKDQKDKLIMQRHELSMERDYWRGKVKRFTATEIPEGFKISQKVDTGIITRYAKDFLGSLFKNRRGNPNVFPINGEMVAHFRKAWGLQDFFNDETGLWEMAPKNRSNHAHHAIDAVTIACITRDSHNRLSHAWRLQEEGQLAAMREVLRETKPWDTFTTDMQQLHEDLIVVHTDTDKPKKQVRKILRKRGVKQRKHHKPEEFIYQQGDTARGALHEETFYGRIMNPHEPEKSKDMFVVRKSIDGMDVKDATKIIDPNIREIVLRDIPRQKALNDRLKALQKEAKDAEAASKATLEAEIKSVENEISRLFHIPPKKGKTVWTPIRKVRIKAKLTEPLPGFKQHRDQSKHAYKQQLYVNNKENYAMAIYRDDKGRHDYALINLMEATQHLKASQRDFRREQDLVAPEMNGKSFFGLIRKNTLVCFYLESPDELTELSEKELTDRLYKAVNLEKDGRMKFQYFQESRGKIQFKSDFENANGKSPEKLMISGYSKYKASIEPLPYYHIGSKNYQFLIQDYHFTIDEKGGITFI
ncbi:CRISPR-associated endonuclease Csn1 [Cyclonatronum proteinivorum]|uniref:CRISPR-associated endonuclease Cas9 n=1 Tax=Cyclonatronum proteinivorum TaxID=1457365 RepID=A0A345UJW5_9BACT|nr:type II CRISPR RNA-guided endonuclease Cas9 [Cyclonatronum proteinivorum]AXJ00767.1 CRISPR-associated endonuclease Csn1 [Cyclonatronum proteinivorum]